MAAISRAYHSRDSLQSLHKSYPCSVVHCEWSKPRKSEERGNFFIDSKMITPFVLAEGASRVGVEGADWLHACVFSVVLYHTQHVC